MREFTPSLELRTSGDVSVLMDRDLAESRGVLVAFSQRGGGRSRAPYASLNLAAHVGDDPVAVDENRAKLLASLGLGGLRDRLTMAEQVHGLVLRVVEGAAGGMGAYARRGGPPPVPGTDALLTSDREVPLLLLSADCVPVVLVSAGSRRGISVVHAGWRGALGRLPGAAALRLAAETGSATADLVAYVGPHIGACHYQVDPARISQFTDAFGSIAAAQGRLDLGAVVAENLREVGVPLNNVVRTGVCTWERTDSFFSFRAEGLTGRHGALAVIL